MNPVFVLGLYIPGIDILKYFKSKNIEVIGYDCLSESFGLQLRGYQVFQCPNPETHEQEWINFFISQASKYNEKPVLFITSDRFVLSVIKHAETLKKYFLFNESYNNVTEKLSSKDGLLELCRKSNVPIPDTIEPKDIEDLIAQLSSLKFPLVIRPKISQRWRAGEIINVVGQEKLIKADNKEELLSWYNKIYPYDKDLLIQEIIVGPDENLLYMVAYADRQHKVAAYFCGQKLRVTPMHFGSATFMKTYDSESILSYAKSLLENNKYWGPAGIEMKKDDRDGEYKIIEVNTRFGLWDVMAEKVGVDLYGITYNDLTGKQVSLQKPKNVEYYWLSISRDIATFWQYRRKGLTGIRKMLGILISKKVYIADLYITQPKLLYTIYLKRVVKKIKKVLRLS